jgi:fermentation-respiration switch protein FrsA (DUF1100 family)
MRKDIKFKTEDGLTLRGWLYVPDGANKPAPTIVMAHGFTCLKEMFLDKYAEIFVKDGLAVLIYDNRNFGDSDGEPRLEVDPMAQVRDYQDAISFAQLLGKTLSHNCSGVSTPTAQRALPASPPPWYRSFRSIRTRSAPSRAPTLSRPSRERGRPSRRPGATK